MTERQQPNKRKRAYRIKDLPIENRQTIGGTLKQVEKDYEAIDKLKRPDEKWLVRIYGNSGWRIFSSAKQLARYMMHGVSSDAIRTGLNSRGKNMQELLGHIELVKTKVSDEQHREAKMEKKLLNKRVYRERAVLQDQTIKKREQQLKDVQRRKKESDAKRRAAERAIKAREREKAIAEQQRKAAIERARNAEKIMAQAMREANKLRAQVKKLKAKRK